MKAPEIRANPGRIPIQDLGEWWTQALVVRDRKPAVTPAAISATMPATNIQTDLSVGVPVKNRDTSDPNESMAITPITTSVMPITARTIDII